MAIIIKKQKKVSAIQDESKYPFLSQMPVSREVVNPFGKNIKVEYPAVRKPNERLFVASDGKLRSATTLRAAAPAKAPVPIPALTYAGPLIIKSGQTISNLNIRSLDSGTPAIWIWTTEKVIITGCTLVSCGDLIKIVGGGDVEVHHNSLYGDLPTNNDQYGRALNMYQPKSVKFYNNYVEHTGGLLLDHVQDGVSPSVDITYNIIRNTDKRRADNSTGDHRAGILFNTVPRAKGRIAFNYFENEEGNSHVEDNVNMYNSGGTESDIFKIHDNFIYGAYPWPVTADYYTGSGITVDGDPGTNTMDKMSQYIDAFNNQVISTCNACMNIAAGHHIRFYDNTMISSGMFPSGLKSLRFWGGCCMWDASNVGKEKFIGNSIKGNTIGYNRDDQSNPVKGRNDWVSVAGSPVSVTASDNKSLPGPITLETESAEFPKWDAKLKANNISIGNTTNNPTPVTTGLKIGKTKQFRVDPTDEAGNVVTYQTGTLVVTSDAYAKAVKGSDERIITVTGVKKGISTFQVSFTSNGGKLITKKQTVEIIDNLPEATGMNIVEL